ncbi:restriction endonuclease [Halorubrum sp. GN12_10-3_MGM]|uniref:restriction endonuclease n=1 Tax=Halorubrum sp. GN12_10-3_MGM TaxID=2518113 RepID=UPI0010F5933C|nr:restriction endonuclease [Halorubrum sp. GN12_10-3_MGM]TKX64319.1 hypothetical protein EXE47_11375 [Halorubrum sp. GN12_10-3_MGM]
MNRPVKTTRRSFLAGISGAFASALSTKNTSAQQNSSSYYPIGLPLEKLLEYKVSDAPASKDVSISLAGIQNDVIYLVEHRNYSDRILAYDQRKEDLRWDHYYTGELNSPVVVEDNLFACSDKKLLAFDIASKPDSPSWGIRVEEGYTGDTASDGDTVWFTNYTVSRTGSRDTTLEISSGTLHAYTKSGSKKWDVSKRFGQVNEYNGTLYETEETWQKEDTEQTYSQIGGQAVVRDAESGRVQWRSEDRDIKRLHPPYDQDTAIALSLDSTLYGYEASSGSLQWKHTVGSEVIDFTTDDIHVFYAVDQKLVAYNPSTAVVEWEQQIPPAYDLTYSQDLLYVGDQNGGIHVFDTQTGERVWDSSLRGTGVTYEWVVDGTLYCVSGNWISAFQGKQAQALNKLQNLRSDSTLATYPANFVGRREALATAEKEIENHKYDEAFAALNRAETLGTAGDGLIWTTGFGTAYFVARRAVHEYNRYQFHDLIDKLKMSYPISKGVLEGISPRELIQRATHIGEKLSDTHLGRPLITGLLVEDDYEELEETIITATDTAPRLQQASVDLETIPEQYQKSWRETLEDAVGDNNFDLVAQRLDQLETRIEIAAFRNKISSSQSSIETDEVGNFIHSLLAPDAEVDKSDIMYCREAAATISKYQSALQTLNNYNIKNVEDKLNESLKAREKSRETDIQNLKRIQRLLEMAISVESKREALDLQYLSLSPEELYTDLQQYLSEFSVDKLEELVRLVENLDAGVWRRDHLDKFTPTEFEHLVSNLYKTQGYTTQVSQASNDKGIDVTVTGEDQTLVIQVKQYSCGNKVGRPTVQQLAGARDQVNANKGVIVTSSSFTRTAQSASRSYGAKMELIDGQELLEMLTKSPVSPPDDTSMGYSGGSAYDISSGTSTGRHQPDRN